MPHPENRREERDQAMTQAVGDVDTGVLRRAVLAGYRLGWRDGRNQPPVPAIPGREMEEDAVLEALGLKRNHCECGQLLEEHSPHLCWLTHEDAHPWVWMDDEDNHLESMGSGMRVLLTAGQLRRLLEGPEAVRAVLMLGGRAKDPLEALAALRDAAWEKRMPGGCHTRTSEILSTMAGAMAGLLGPEDKG